jgi:hypothetical protein
VLDTSDLDEAEVVDRVAARVASALGTDARKPPVD